MSRCAFSAPVPPARKRAVPCARAAFMANAFSDRYLEQRRFPVTSSPNENHYKVPQFEAGKNVSSPRVFCCSRAAILEKPAERIDNQTGQPADQGAVDADELEVAAHRQLDSLRRSLRVPLAYRVRHQLADLVP